MLVAKSYIETFLGCWPTMMFQNVTNIWNLSSTETGFYMFHQNGCSQLVDESDHVNDPLIAHWLYGKTFTASSAPFQLL